MMIPISKPNLVERLRLHGKGECRCSHCMAPVEAAFHIEKLELQCVHLHDDYIKACKGILEAHEHIRKLEAALWEIAELYRDPAGKGAKIARRALGLPILE